MRIYLLVLLLLAGCMTVEDRRALMLQNAEKNCTQMGFVPGSPEHSTCQLELVKAAVGAPRTVTATPSRATTCVTSGNTMTCN